MVNEVETILNEIRERVRADSAPFEISGESPTDLTLRSAVLETKEISSANRESLERLSAHLATTARAWDRLPPLYSNRKGTTAQLELWIKGRIRKMTRWFTWEQVNFNSSVHQALAETLQTLSACRQELAGIRTESRRETEMWREKFARGDKELAALRISIEAITAEIRKRDAQLAARGAAIEAATETRLAGLAAANLDAIEETRANISTQMAALAAELRESNLQLRDEQRVCFKQLSLEASETTVSEDRSHRAIESRLQKLEKHLSNGGQ